MRFSPMVLNLHNPRRQIQQWKRVENHHMAGHSSMNAWTAMQATEASCHAW
jgi:hypothetical protein